ncbi:MAG: palindromic element RPE5 domain-containing protein [Rickettsia endosymbiont of Pentastiridius leporinus]
MKSYYTKINLKKSKEFVSRRAERILICEHLRSYKNDVANFSSSSSINTRNKIKLIYQVLNVRK